MLSKDLSISQNNIQLVQAELRQQEVVMFNVNKYWNLWQWTESTDVIIRLYLLKQ